MDDPSAYVEHEEDSDEQSTKPVLPFREPRPTGTEGATITSNDDDVPAPSGVLLEEEVYPIMGHALPVPHVHEPTLRVAKRCHVGAVRERNEDSCLIFESETGGHFTLLPFGLYIVADGMGGHKNGHVASKIASRTAANHIINKIYMPLLQNDGTANQTPIQEVMEDSVAAAHRALYDPEADRGTTLSIALVLGRRLYVAHVGDTRVYLQTSERLETITNDHSLVKRLQDVGTLTAEEANTYQYRHVLLRAVGQGEDLEVDTYTRLLPKTGKLLLCSDGLCGFVADTQIEKIMRQEMSVQKTADKLFAAAMEAGSSDNVTAIVVEFNL